MIKLLVLDVYWQLDQYDRSWRIGRTTIVHVYILNVV